MKGLEEIIEYEEESIEFQKRVVLHVSAIIISSALLFKDIKNFLENKNKNL